MRVAYTNIVFEIIYIYIYIYIYILAMFSIHSKDIRKERLMTCFAKKIDSWRIYIYIYIYIYSHTHIYIYICINVCVYVRVCVYSFIRYKCVPVLFIYFKYN